RSHGLVESTDNGGLLVTPIGELAGEAGVEVESIIRLVEALGQSDPVSLTDATLITAAQITVELDQVLFPFNRSSTIKEPQTWLGELQNQRVAAPVQRALYRAVEDKHTATLRAQEGCRLPRMG